jgi:hypothetical protein
MSQMLKILCIITAKGCGHCEMMRIFDSNGQMLPESTDVRRGNVPGGEKWSKDFILHLIYGLPMSTPIPATATPIYRVLNVHYQSLGNGLPANLNEVIEFTPTNPMTLTANHSTTNFESIIPKGIARYVVQFPSFAIFDAESWDRNLQDAGPLIGELDGLRVAPQLDGGITVYGVDRTRGVGGRMQAPTVWAGSRRDQPVPIPPSHDVRKVPPGLSVTPGTSEVGTILHRLKTIPPDEPVVNSPHAVGRLRTGLAGYQILHRGWN